MTTHALKLAESYLFAGDLEDALTTLTDALSQTDAATSLSIEERDAARRLRAAVLMRLGQTADARADIDALSVRYDYDDYQRSLIAERDGDLDGAIKAAMSAWQSQNRYHWRDEHENRQFIDRVFERVIHLLIAAGRTIQADVMLSAAHYQTAGWLHIRGDIAVEAGRYDDALQHYTAALDSLRAKLHTDNSVVRNQRGILRLKRARCLRLLERFAEAQQALTDAAADLDDPAIGIERGLIHFELHPDDVDGAVTLCRAALDEVSAAPPSVLTALREPLTSARYAVLAGQLGE